MFSTIFPIFLYLCALWGFLRLLKHIYQTLKVVVLDPVKPSILMSFYRTGSYAIVTGASDGIGKEFALQLASRGWNIVLISRNQQKLEDVAKEISTVNPKVSTMIIELDFSRAQESDFESIANQLKGKEITVLVNNVGASHELPETFLDISSSKLDDLIRLNIHAITYLTRVVLPGMVQLKRGLVINIGSSSAGYPHPMYSVYSASKAYIEYLSLALSHEFKSSGIHVECLVPYLIKTKLSKIRSVGRFRPSPQTYVSSALKGIGYRNKRAGYFWHEIFSLFVKNMIDVMGLDFVMSRTHEMLFNARRKNLERSHVSNKN
eukprot:TRINITY_DN8682_c0_g1_i1.p1 TRINITY_DN8682_c0_g1~~TRINITY_DN8682_c0_g1_i1.p1  ORF type:complete len:320 (-),score=38.62 TRINITY_DN8682_c0_g1_i1:15-974(-)